MTDLSHIYHRPGELFWLECDPFQRAVPCWLRYEPYERSIGHEYRRGAQFVRVDIYDYDSERIEYEVWVGNDESGNWEPLSFHRTFHAAKCAMRTEARKRNRRWLS